MVIDEHFPVDMFAMFTLRRPDILPVGMYELRLDHNEPANGSQVT